jgi:iron donor protein CyaY
MTVLSDSNADLGADSNDFAEIASDTIFTIIDTIEKYDPAGVIQIELEGDIITFIVPENKKYVLNKHNSYRQIWLASPISGPHHFSYVKNKWINSGGLLLADLLTSEFSQFVNKIKFYL